MSRGIVFIVDFSPYSSHIYKGLPGLKETDDDDDDQVSDLMLLGIKAVEKASACLIKNLGMLNIIIGCD